MNFRLDGERLIRIGSYVGSQKDIEYSESFGASGIYTVFPLLVF